MKKSLIYNISLLFMKRVIILLSLLAVSCSMGREEVPLSFEDKWKTFIWDIEEEIPDAPWIYVPEGTVGTYILSVSVRDEEGKDMLSPDFSGNMADGLTITADQPGLPEKEIQFLLVRTVSEDSGIYYEISVPAFSDSVVLTYHWRDGSQDTIAKITQYKGDRSRTYFLLNGDMAETSRFVLIK